MDENPPRPSEARRTAYSARTAAACESIASKVSLLAFTVSRETPGRRPARGPRSPVRSDVLDLLTVLHGFVEDTAPLARDLQLPDDGNAGQLRAIAARFRLVGSVLADLERIDYARYVNICARVWKLWIWTADVVGQPDPPRHVSEPCARCGRETLWISPERGVMACTEAGCLTRFPVDTPLPDTWTYDR